MAETPVPVIAEQQADSGREHASVRSVPVSDRVEETREGEARAYGAIGHSCMVDRRHAARDPPRQANPTMPIACRCPQWRRMDLRNASERGVGSTIAIRPMFGSYLSLTS